MKDRVKAVATLPLHSPSPLVAPARQCPLSLIEEEKMPVTEENLNESGKGTEHLCANEGHGAGTEEAAARTQTTSSRDPEKGRINLVSFCQGIPTTQEWKEGVLPMLQDLSMAELQQIAVDSGFNPDLEKAALAKILSIDYLKYPDKSSSDEKLNESGTGTEHLRANEGHGAVTEESAARAQTTSSRDVPDQGKINMDLFLASGPTAKEFKKGILPKLQDLSVAELHKIALDRGLNPNLEKAALAKSISIYLLKDQDMYSSEGDADANREFFAKGQDYGEDSSAKAHNSDGNHSDEERDDSDEGPFLTKSGTKGQRQGAVSKVRLPPLCSRKKQLHCMAIRQLPRSGFAGVVIISQAAKSAATRCPVCQRAAATHEWINPCTDYSMRQVVLS